MSGFDVLFKSQQQMQQTRLGYDKMRYGMEQQLGQTLGQLPQNYLAGAKAASDLRIQEQQAELSAMQSKMQLSNMFEQSKQLQTQTKLGDLQLRQAQYTFDNQAKTTAYERQRDLKDRNQKLAATMAKYGMKLSDDGLSFKKMTPEEIRIMNPDTGVRANELDVKRAAEARARIKDIVSTTKNFISGYNLDKLTPQQQEDIKRLEAVLMKGLTGEERQAVAQDLYGSAAASSDPQATQATQPDTTAQPGGFGAALQNDTPEVNQQFGMVDVAIQGNDQLNQMFQGLDPESAGSMKYGMAKVADIQVGMGTITAERAAAHVVNEFANGKNPNLQAYVMAVAGRTDDQIAAYIMSRPYMQDRKIKDRRAVADSVIKSIRQTIPASEQDAAAQDPQQPAAATATAPSTATSPAVGPSSPTAKSPPKPGEPGYITGVDKSLEDSAVVRSGFGSYQGPAEVAATGQPSGPSAPFHTAEVTPQDRTTVPPVGSFPSRLPESAEVPSVQSETDPEPREASRMAFSNPKASVQDLLKGMGGKAKQKLTPLLKGLRGRVGKMREARGPIAAQVAEELEQLQGKALRKALPVAERFRQMATELRGASPEYAERLLRDGENALRELGQDASKPVLKTLRDTIRQVRLSRRLDRDIEDALDDIRNGFMTEEEGAAFIKRLKLSYEMESSRRVVK